MNAADDIRRAELDLIAASNIVEKGWAQGDVATDAHGSPVSLLSRDATCWCAVSSIVLVTSRDSCDDDEWLNRSYNAASLLAQRIGRSSDAPSCAGFVISRWNDDCGRTKAEVLAAMRGSGEGTTIERQRREQANEPSGGAIGASKSCNARCACCKD